MKAQITFSINKSIQKVENTPTSTTVTTRYDHFKHVPFLKDITSREAVIYLAIDSTITGEQLIKIAKRFPVLEYLSFKGIDGELHIGDLFHMTLKTLVVGDLLTKFKQLFPMASVILRK